jgi:hypothetical protein
MLDPDLFLIDQYIIFERIGGAVELKLRAAIVLLGRRRKNLEDQIATGLTRMSSSSSIAGCSPQTVQQDDDRLRRVPGLAVEEPEGSDVGGLEIHHQNTLLGSLAVVTAG